MAQLIIAAPDAAAAVLAQLLGQEPGVGFLAGPGRAVEGAAAFQRGFRDTLARVLHIKVGRCLVGGVLQGTCTCLYVNAVLGLLQAAVASLVQSKRSCLLPRPLPGASGNDPGAHR
jgi:hypothetical protein